MRRYIREMTPIIVALALMLAAFAGMIALHRSAERQAAEVFRRTEGRNRAQHDASVADRKEIRERQSQIIRRLDAMEPK